LAVHKVIAIITQLNFSAPPCMYDSFFDQNIACLSISVVFREGQVSPSCLRLPATMVNNYSLVLKSGMQPRRVYGQLPLPKFVLSS